MEPAPEPTPKAASSAANSRLLPRLCIAYVIIAVIVWLLVRYASDRWWPATVLLFAPRWPWLLPLLVLLPLSTRRRKLFWLPLLTGLFVLWPLMGLCIPGPHPADTSGLKIRLLTCNLHKLELNRKVLDEYIAATRPDVIAFQDYSGWDDSPGLFQPPWHTYRLGSMFLASRFPITRVHDLQLERITGIDDSEFPRRIGSAVCFDLKTPAGTIQLLNLHLASPHQAIQWLSYEPRHGIFALTTNSERRANESQLITDWLAAQRGPFIVAGDFNTPAESPIYRAYWSKYPDSFPTTAFGYGYTHCTPLSELRIDHILSGPGVACVHCEIGPPCGTPHRPLVADLLVHAPPVMMQPTNGAP